jgi:hypothetical protein
MEPDGGVVRLVASTADTSEERARVKRIMWDIEERRSSS